METTPPAPTQQEIPPLEAPQITDSPQYRAAVVDILGALAYAELSAFSQMAADADLAPTHGLKADVAALAVQEFLKYQAIALRLEQMGVDPDDAMAPFVAAIDGFHQRTEPSDFHEGIVKAYVGEGIAQDFYREIAAFLDPHTREFVLTVLAKTPARRDFVVAEVRSATADDARLAGRLALWGRRLVGEALSQAQSVTADRESIALLLVGGTGFGADLAEIGRMFARITQAHTRRMTRMGLSS